MDNTFLALCTLGMCLGAFLPRVLPISFLAKRQLPSFVQTWLSFVPVAILAALVAPEVFMQNEKLFLSQENAFLLAFIPTLFVAYLSKSLFITLSAGMAFVAALRYFALAS